MTVGEFIAELLCIENVSQADMAADIKMYQSTLNDIIKGKRKITPKNAKEIGRFLGIPPMVLIIWQTIDLYNDEVL